MSLRLAILASLGLAVLGLGACATTDPTDLGESKNEFEQSSQGGNYRFQYIAEGADGYRAILWRQGESLSDDRKDEQLVATVVRAVFLEKFCQELKQPVSLANGSPAPLGSQGKWIASLRCATPPPPPPKAKPEKKKPVAKPKPASDGEVLSEANPKPEPAPESAAAADDVPKPKPASKPKPPYDGPVVCEANKDGGFDCKPKR